MSQLKQRGAPLPNIGTLQVEHQLRPAEGLCEELTQGTYFRAPNNRHGAAERKRPPAS
jgi:hypothetical protein